MDEQKVQWNMDDDRNNGGAAAGCEGLLGRQPWVFH